jgi:hypothetical protein
MNLYLEIFGYIGTALVIISMMMTSVIKLRVINMCGSLISLIYAVCVNTWPVAVLNACLLCINFVQTLRQLRHKSDFTELKLDANDLTVQHFLSVNAQDVQKYFPNYRLQAHRETEIHMIYVECEAVGLLVGTRASDVYRIEMDYVVPKYRDISGYYNLDGYLGVYDVLSEIGENGLATRKRIAIKNDGTIEDATA